MTTKNKSSLSKSRDYHELGEFWDTHDLGNYWKKTRKVDFEIAIEEEITYYVVDKEISEKIQFIAKKRGISAHKLVNSWLEEKTQEENLS
ncbi:MAG: hypothetical protein HeimC3_39080 [Candidatus Heimdallarchaeota archaeon LC_3]|nr:MAG: hypothetical protein HeimC3_39080 [Candidatus Heimdallarchaeota archaeon LC_3]